MTTIPRHHSSATFRGCDKPLWSVVNERGPSPVLKRQETDDE